MTDSDATGLSSSPNSAFEVVPPTSTPMNDPNASSSLLFASMSTHTPDSPHTPKKISRVYSLTMRLSSVYTVVHRHVFGGMPPSFGAESRLHRRPLTDPHRGISNNGWDNENGDLLVHVGMELRQYEVVDILGSGTFGVVYKCIDIRTHQLYALKILKNIPEYERQADAEQRTLDLLTEAMRCASEEETPHEGIPYIVATLPAFQFEMHKCIPMELLDLNLYEVIRFNNHKGLSMNSVRVMAKQLLRAMDFLHKNSVIHCDMKLENVLIDTGTPPCLKVVDFGSAATFEEVETQPLAYIQSRYYRAPEVLVGAQYDCKIDLWSLGCVLVEVFLGLPLLPGVNDWHQLARVEEMFGPLPTSLLEAGEDTMRFYKTVADSDEYVRMTEDEFVQMWSEEKQQWKPYFKYTTLEDIIMHYHMPRTQPEHIVMLERAMLCDFLQGLLQVNPEHRWPAEIALEHPFLSSLPLQQQPAFIAGDFHQDYLKTLAEEEEEKKQSS